MSLRKFLTRDISAHKIKNPPVRMWKYGKDDLVEVITGPHKGQRAVITKVQRRKNRVFLKGLMLQKKRIKETAQSQGGFIYKEGPIHYSNVLLIDPTDNRRCRVKWRFLESGKRVRVSTRTNTIIPRPVTYVRPVRKDGPKDTPSSEVLIKTFDELSVVPVLDEDLLERIQLKWSLLADARAKREEEKKKAIIENATKPDEVKIKKKPIWITQMEEDLRNHQVLQGSIMPTLLADKKKGVNQELLDEADADDKLGASSTIRGGDVNKKEQDEAAHDEDEGDEKPAASNKKKKLKGKKKQ